MKRVTLIGLVGVLAAMGLIDLFDLAVLVPDWMWMAGAVLAAGLLWFCVAGAAEPLVDEFKRGCK